MPGDDAALCRGLEALEALRTLEPGRVVAGEPALRDAVAPVLDDVAVIADEEEGAAVGQVNLHADEAVRVARQVVQRDALAKVNGAFVERLPVEIQLQVVRHVHADVGARRHAPEGGPQLPIVHPDLDVLAVQELVEPASVVEVQVSDDDLLDIVELVARRFDGRFELVLGFVAHARENVGNLGAPDGGIVLWWAHRRYSK